MFSYNGPKQQGLSVDAAAHRRRLAWVLWRIGYSP